ncbi:MAG: poly-gamma-glutamate biosynthesis protein PgsC/CapC [Novosphingobium sp.]
MLPIFPEGALTSSVITTVWVGVFVLAFFNLRFGWVMSGLVVPGYVVPLLVLRPFAAGVIVVEAILTYLIAYFFSERFSRGRYNALFGRDRFMALILASIAVRLTFDGWLLPQAAEWLSRRYDWQFDWHSNLQSFGLVVISLMANQFWKPGLARGLIAAAVTIGLTWLIVRYGLMEFTNFRLSGVTYVYEGLASSILASPKAYIILVLTAFIASQMNVRYGWDFSGILIPALIALQWYQPTKVLSSIVEAGVIYLLAIAVMKLPLFASMTIEGSRKLVLFFNVSFVYKLVLGHGLGLLALDVKTTDFYGFGYLLSTLLAIKAYDKNIFPRVMRNTLEVSIAGAVAGNLAGFGLAILLPANSAAVAARVKSASGQETGYLLAAAVGDGHLHKAGIPGVALKASELRALGDAIQLLESGARPDLVAPAMLQEGFLMSPQSDGTWALSRASEGQRDLLVFNPAASRRLAVIAVDPARQPGLAAASLALFASQRARWLVVSGSNPEAGDAKRSLIGVLRKNAHPDELAVVAGTGETPRLELGGGAAASLDLAVLRGQLPGLAVRFALEGTVNRGELVLGGTQLVLLASPATVANDLVPECRIEVTRPAIDARLDLAQLAFLRFEVVEPVLAGLSAKAGLPEVARRNAALAGWELGPCDLDGKRQWRLAWPDGTDSTFFFTPGAEGDRIVQTEGSSRRLISTAAVLHARWNSSVLMIAADDDRLAGSQRSPFGVVSQAVLRAGSPGSARLIQLRKSPAGSPPVAGAIALVPDLIERNSNWLGQMRALADMIGLPATVVDRTRATAGLEIAPNMSIRYFSETGRGRHATFWLVPEPAKLRESKP